MQPNSENHTPQLTVVGLGPGAWETLTLEAVEALRSARRVYVRSSLQPSVGRIRTRLPHVEFQTFDHLYKTLSSLSEVHAQIAEELCDLATSSESVVYAVPGSPVFAETSVDILRRRARERDITVRLINGVSVVETVLAEVGAVDTTWLSVVDASELALLGAENAVGEVAGEVELMPWRAPVATAAMVVLQLHDRRTASGAGRWLARYYGDEHAVHVVRAAGTPSSVQSVRLHQLDLLDDIDDLTAVYVPPLPDNENVRTFAGLMNVTRTLRAPGGCPWDREQTHASLKPHLLEETYEVLEALDGGDPQELAEELGDLLFQVTIHSQVAAEAGEFSIEDVIQGITSKLIGRHPHVFGDLQLDSAQDVRQHWETFKQQEKPKRLSVLEEIPRGLPALPQSNLMQKRAASVGFEWPGVAEVVAKVEEELEELKREVEGAPAMSSPAPPAMSAEGASEVVREGPQARAPGGTSREQQREELGDILFALVSLARHLRIDPEEALRRANRKFAARFQYVESRVASQDRALRDLSPDELDAYWNEAKALGTAHSDT